MRREIPIDLQHRPVVHTPFIEGFVERTFLLAIHRQRRTIAMGVDPHAAFRVKLKPVPAGDVVKRAVGELKMIGAAVKSRNHGTDIEIIHETLHWSHPSLRMAHLKRRELDGDQCERLQISMASERSYRGSR